MVYVVATVSLKPGVMPQYLELFAANRKLVLAEDGCIDYTPTCDLPTGLAAQGEIRADTVVICEKWESLEALRAHLAAPHMAVWRENVKSLVISTKLQVTKTAS